MLKIKQFHSLNKLNKYLNKHKKLYINKIIVKSKNNYLIEYRERKL